MELNEIDASSIKNICGNIMAESDFWYQKAIEAWTQWKDMSITDNELQNLLSIKYDDFAIRMIRGLRRFEKICLPLWLILMLNQKTRIHITAILTNELLPEQAFARTIGLRGC